VHPSGDPYLPNWQGVITLTPEEATALLDLVKRLTPVIKPQPVQVVPGIRPAFHTVTEYERTAANVNRLAQWRSDDYNEWVKVGATIKRALGEAGFGLWDGFSRRSAKCKANDPARKWATFKGSGDDRNACKMLTGWANQDDPGGKWTGHQP
jgi:hypothetical protein